MNSVAINILQCVVLKMIDNHEIYNEITRIRNHINRIEKQSILLQKLSIWFQLCSSMDTVEDTQCAIDFYVITDYPDSISGKYLYTYGLLQALYLQQDALINLNEALGFKKIDYRTEFPELYEIREIRNDVTGHPTKRNGKQFIQLSQITMEKFSFNYMISEEGQKSDFRSIDINKIIQMQKGLAKNILTNIVEKLEQEFKEYIELHRDRKMSDIFQLLGYAREKVFTDHFLARWGFEAVKTMIDKCKGELDKRYESWRIPDSYHYLLEDIDELYALIETQINEIPIDISVRVNKYLLENLFTKMEELKEYCNETDEYFENYGNNKTESEDTEEDIKFILLPGILGTDETLL